MKYQSVSHLFYNAVRIIDAQPQRSVDDISDELRVNSRQLRRLFQQNMGMSPKQYLRLKRFHKAVKIAFSAETVDFQKIVYHCGYYDQSHFCKDIREFTGQKPIDFFRQKSNFPLVREKLLLPRLPRRHEVVDIGEEFAFHYVKKLNGCFFLFFIAFSL